MFDADGARIVSISYLALTREPEGDDPSGSADSQAGWQDWYRNVLTVQQGQ